MAEKGKNGLRIGFVLSMTGAMVAYYVGASTGSGQEFFQAYSSHGTIGAVGVTIHTVVVALLALAVMLVCKKYNLAGAKECFIWFLGKYIGTAVYYYTVAFVFCTLIQLLSGTGNIITQYYGLPYWVGAVGLAALSIMSVLFGFNRLIAIISKIAPFIVVIMVISAIAGLINPTDGLAAGTEMALSSTEIFRTNPNWLVSTLLHHTYLILFIVPYFVSCYTMDREATNKEIISWVVIAFSILTVLCVLMVLSQVANMSITMTAQAPNVIIASTHVPWLAGFFVLMIVAASFTTTSPIALIAAEYFAEPGTKKFKLVGTGIVLAALAISFAGSYAQIINVLVSVSGRIGLAIYIIAIFYRLYRYIKDKKEEPVINKGENVEA